MPGMNANTGYCIDGQEHLKQSIRDILSTPIGSRVMRRNYGSPLFKLLDQPITPALIGQMQAVIADTLQRHEPRIKFSRIVVRSVADGQLAGQLKIDLEGYYLNESTMVTFSNLLIK